ncbi:MAG: hypothetical protein JSV54_02730, partial [Chloroflexota bacterium]
MNSNICKVGVGIAVVVMMLFSACLVTPNPEGDKSPVISSLEAQYMNVYPRGASEIRCIASDPEGG